VLPPPTTLVDGEEEYEVEAILDSRMCYNRLEYLLKFKGYDESHNQWEVHTHVHAKPKIALFHRKPQIPRRSAPYQRGDNPNRTQTPEYTKDKYNVKIIKRKGSLLRSHQQPT
jgi:hypothetical protein